MLGIRSSLRSALLASLLGLQALEPAAMHADLAALEKSIRATWSYLELREQQGLDLEASFERARGRTAEPLEPEGFAVVLRELVAELRDGHAYVTVPGEVWPPRRLPFLLCDVAEGLAIERVAQEIEVVEGKAPPQVGELVHALDGQPIADVVADHLRAVYASTPGMARRAAFTTLGRLSAELETVAVELEDAAGDRRVVVLRTPIGWVPGLDDHYIDPEEGWVLSFPREDIALLRIPTFAHADQRAWREARPADRDALLADTKRTIEERFREIADSGASALVLDLRGNGGGTDLLGQHLARHLIAERCVYFGLSSKGFFGWSRSRYRIAPEPGMHGFGGPVLALIDEGAFSVTDNLLRCLTDVHPDFTTVGRPSGGGTGAPRSLDPLPHSGAVITLCTMRVYGPAGELIEGSGTVPDIPITRSRADLAAGHDADLAAALRLLDERAAGADGR